MSYYNYKTIDIFGHKIQTIATYQYIHENV